MTRTASQVATQPQSTPKSAARSEASEESISMNEVELHKLITFFRLLDKWDREAKNNGKIM